MARQGTDRHALRQRGDDLYETPEEATRTLIRVETLPPAIWEPAAGRGAIVRMLRAAGHTVIASDLVAHPGADPGIMTPVGFLLEYRAPPGCDCIVTNPPFKLADQFIRHGLQLVDRVIVLQRLAALEGARRDDLLAHHLVHVWVGIERLPMMHRDGWTGARTDTGTAPFAWFEFSATRRARDVPIALRRMSWRQLHHQETRNVR